VRPGLAEPRAIARHLRSADSGLLGQLVRFGLTGGLVTIVYLTVTTVLSKVVGLAFELALAIGFVTAISLHFTLQRLFVWIHEDDFALALHRQVRRYLLMAGAQYGCTAASTAILPGVLGVDSELVYLATMAVATTTGFVVMRFVIFHSSGRAEQPRTTGETPATRPLRRSDDTEPAFGAHARAGSLAPPAGRVEELGQGRRLDHGEP
jgi:putative flippase GtrA